MLKTGALLAILMISVPAAAQTPPATPGAPKTGPCGKIPAQADYDFEVFKNGNIFDKNAGGHFFMSRTAPTLWAICNDSDTPVEIKFVRLACGTTPTVMCPVDWINPDGLERCAGEVHSVNGNQLRIPIHEWGTIQGSPNANRDECPDANNLQDIYDFKVSVKPDGGAEQVIDPQIEVDRDTLFARRYVV